MIAPFVDPDLEWDFRLPRVASINTSGHKYGLVYPGVGWVVWRDADALPEDLIFWVNYLGDNMPTFALNFSRPGAQVVAQYYNFLRLGFEGYRKRAGVRAGRRDGARGPDRRGRAVPAADTRRRASGLRLHARGRRSTTSPSSTSRTRCASAAGRCPRTRSPRTGPTSPRSGSSSGAASRTTWRTCSSATSSGSCRGSQRQPAPVHDAEEGTALRALTGAVWKDRPSDVSTGDHHSAYLAKTVAALTPEGRERVDELLEQLVEVAGGRERLVRFAAARKSEADLGRTERRSRTRSARSRSRS